MPDLPFELIISYLSLQDCIGCRTLSRRWCGTINRLRIKILCFWRRPSFNAQRRLFSGALARNFVSSARFDLLCQTTLDQSILSSLKQRLCDLRLGAEQTITFGQVLNLFGQLEELDIVQFKCLPDVDTNPCRYTFCFMSENSLRLAKQIPFSYNLICKDPPYFSQELIPSISETSILKRFIDLSSIIVFDLGHPDYPGHLRQDIERFLKNLDNIRDLRVSYRRNYHKNQQQVLLDQLPDYCPLLQKLHIPRSPFNFRFLFRLKHLIQLNVESYLYNINLLRTIYKELKFLQKFRFSYSLLGVVSIEVEHHPKRFKVYTWNSVFLTTGRTQVSDIDSAIRFILEKAKKESPKVFDSN